MTPNACNLAYFPNTAGWRPLKGHREPLVLWNYKVHPAAPNETLRYAVSRDGRVVHRCESWKAAKGWALDQLERLYTRMAEAGNAKAAAIGAVLQQYGRFR